jgi:hypothetical protein
MSYFNYEFLIPLSEQNVVRDNTKDFVKIIPLFEEGE